MTSEDDDVAEGVLAVFNAIPSITTLCPGGLVHGRQKPTATQGQVYAVLDVMQGPTSAQEGWQTGGTYIDFRHVKIEVYGPKPEASPALNAIRGTFDAEISKGQDAFEVPNTLGTIQVRPILGDDLRQEDHKSQGEDVWIGTAEYEVWTFRRRPS